MHPTTSHQIASLQAAELRRRADLRSGHAPTRRARGRHAVSGGAQSSLGRTWNGLATLRSA